MVSKLSENSVAGFCKKVTDQAVCEPGEIIDAFPNRTEVAA